MRRWLDEHGYVEVLTPSRVPSPAMEEHLHAVAADGAFLRTSPEFALKRVVASGLPRIYEIGPCWRDREHGEWHATEFFMLEFYRAGARLPDLMDEVEALVGAAAAALDVSAPALPRRTVRDLFLEHTGVDLHTASATDLSDHHEGYDDAFFRRWVGDVEPHIGSGFVTEWPASLAALAQIRTDGPWPHAERFEVFVNGVELGNAFFELIDPREQRHRFVSANAARLRAGERPHPIDERFVEAVGRMPSCAGIAIGIDRLVASLSGWSGIAPGRVESP